MTEQLRMSLLASRTMFEVNETSDSKSLIAYLAHSVIFLLRERGDEDSIDLANILLIAALQSNFLDESGKSLISSIIEGDEDAES